MGDYHFVYKDVEGTSTEWDDLQRKFGNLPPKPAPFKPPAWAPDDEDSKQKDKDWIDRKNEEELEDLEDDLDDDRFLEEYRKKRLEELKMSARIPRFGSVIPIVGADFVREVSQAPPDVWVVVFLYKEGITECGLLFRCLEELAERYPFTKFVKIISTDCIPNYPDRNLPTVLVYNNGAVKATYVGLHHFGSQRCTAEGVAFKLCQSDPVLRNSENESDSSRQAVMEGVRKQFIQRVVSQHEDDDSDESSD
ncbi:Phosducin-like protein 3 [Nymphaea thermarum]|nr:Phosducin-like protein 3 [Nymphaea thermarum]